MLQNVARSCNESDGHWLPLIEYSVKSGVSLSTIRRKIKSNSIPYRLERGKYLILFQEKAQAMPSGPAALTPYPMIPRQDAETDAEAPTQNKEDEDSWSMQMLSDAFEHAIKEKDERIRLLEQLNSEMRQQLSELRVLVKMLEEKFEVRY